MLKFLSHFWLVLSLLVAPVQFASADMAALDHGQMKCEMMDMDGAMDKMGQMDHDMSSQDGSCECPDQCKVSCTAAHMSLATSSVLQMLHVSSSTKLDSRSSSITGIDQLTELRPPRKFHA
ncbi:MAG: hypothetical protein KAT25_04865 [Sulfuriflexus sp.]|nr:hypothetical protein [Sulfuriflexus sp.]